MRARAGAFAVAAVGAGVALLVTGYPTDTGSKVLAALLIASGLISAMVTFGTQVPPAPRGPGPKLSRATNATLEELRSEHPNLRAIREVEAATGDPSRVELILRGVTERLQAREVLLQRARDVERRSRSLVARFADGEMTSAAYETARNTLDSDRAEIQAELVEIDAELFADDFEKPV